MDSSSEPATEVHNDDEKLAEAEVNNTSASSGVVENVDTTSEEAANTSTEG